SVIMEDFEGNGLLDLMISSTSPTGQLRYFRNNGDGTFTERTKEAGLMGEVGGLNLVTTDYNNDGRPDVVVLRGAWLGSSGHYPLSLLRNDGGGHFTDVTLQAGLLSLGPTQTAVAFDYNGDGWLDLFVGYESTDGDPVPCKLFRNNRNGTFTDVTARCGLHLTRYVKAVISADYTHSGRPGLYISCQGQPNVLLRNDGPAGPDHSPTAPWKFTDVSRQSGACHGTGTFSCFFFDYDNDGWPDLYVGGWGKIRSVGDIAADYLGLPTPAAKSHLYRNNHDGTFTDVSRQAHLDKVIEGMGINYGDLDNDGWPDFYVGTGTPDLETLVPNRMFRNHGGRYFDEVTVSGGFGHLQKGHGIAFGDLDNSGQQDVFEVMGGAYEGDTAHDCLYVNPGSHNHWVTLKLEGVRCNRIALGAQICVTAATPQGERKVYRTVSTGGSFGNNPLRQEVGLGDATAITAVTIQWPGSGTVQVVRGVGLDQFYRVREGEAVARLWRVPHFRLPARPAPGAMPIMPGMTMK
ncbi:MAG: CRTAC1 family protein, partial [Armatimonadetes bacterium]|nr:CRTAC1 family protein [Armatimonadota bacterium]